ncbi:MAG: hypothetical protein JSV17_14755 [Candidatus Aminicenantes bacterium]|nr:MAG: hypothetical protein JSV17_14755 [Candidatus Aminicenantes bacterium]
MQVYMLFDTIKKKLHEHVAVLSFFEKIPEFILANKIPEDMILFTAEFFYHPERMCEIVLLIAENATHLGRKETYENCIFSNYTESSGETIVLNNVKTLPSFLELDPRINAEIFCQCKISAGLSLILNMECSSAQVSEQASSWFARVKEKILLSSAPDSIV